MGTGGVLLTASNGYLKRMISVVSILFGKGKRKEKDLSLPLSLTPEEPRPYLEASAVREGIDSVRIHDLSSLVCMPSGVLIEEWYAWHTLSFFQHISLIHGTLSDHCTPTTCPSMNAPNNVVYQWADEKGKKMKCTAPQYIDYAMSFCQKIVNDPLVFPTKYGMTFPTSFHSTIRRMNRYLFHIVAHLYQVHFQQAIAADLHGHLNTFFAHFTAFNQEYDLVDTKETDILADLAAALQQAHREAPVSPMALDAASVAALAAGSEAVGAMTVMTVSSGEPVMASPDLEPVVILPSCLNGDDKENHNTTLMGK